MYIYIYDNYGDVTDPRISTFFDLRKVYQAGKRTRHAQRSNYSGSG